MAKIAVVVDSTAVIEKEIIESHDNLYSLPLQVIIDDEAFRDGVDITPSEFCIKMEQAPKLPTTSQPPVGEVYKLFEKLIGEYDSILYITISSKLSGTYQTAVSVRNEISEEKIFVFDSLFTATIQKQMAMKALELIEKGSSMEEIVQDLEYIKENSKIYLVVDDLGHLRRTGRVSLSAATIGKLMSIKPILVFEDGEIIVQSKVRTMNKVLSTLAEFIENAKLTSNSKIIIAHANGYDSALKLREKVREIYPEQEINIEELSPVVSVHTGGQSFGLSWVY